MRFLFVLINSLLIFVIPGEAQNYKKIHRKAIVADTHNDFLSVSVQKSLSFDQDLSGETHSDLNRMFKAGIDLQVFSVWCDQTYLGEAAFAHANREIDTLEAIINRNKDRMMFVGSPADMKKSLHSGKLGALIGVEGGHMIDDQISNLDSLYIRGARYLTLTWNNSTSWASSASDETLHRDSLAKPGLNEFGKEIVQRMNSMGMMIDVSHIGEQTFADVMKITTKPVIASHSCVWGLAPVFRNLRDDQIRAIGKNKGVIQVNFSSGFIDSNFAKKNAAFIQRHQSERDSLLLLNQPQHAINGFLFKKYKSEVEEMRPPLSLLIDHIDYIVNLIGIDHVGIGSDFDGITSSPKELNDVTDFPLITKELVSRGYSRKQIRKILGGNFIRVFEANSAKN